MRVLVTRPKASGERTAKKLEARGHQPVLLPLTKAVHDLQATSAGLAASTGALVVTSAEAIRALGALGGSLSAHLGRPLFAVGKATAEKASAAGFSTVHHSSGDGAELADHIAGLRHLLGDRPLTYLAGSPRASGLEAGLLARGIAFDTVESYRMEPVDPSNVQLRQALLDRPVAAMLFYSRHSAERFFALGYVAENLDRLKNTRLLCLSATIATIVPYPLRSGIAVASVPEEERLLDLLDPDGNANLL